MINLLKKEKSSKHAIIIALSSLLVLVLVIFLSLFLVSPNYIHEAAEEDISISPEPEAMEEILWTWSPEGDSYRRVLRGAAGPIIVSESGIAALDGSDGREIWSFEYKVEGEMTVGVTPDEKSVLVGYFKENSNSPEIEIKVFDSLSGEMVSDYEREFRSKGEEWEEWKEDIPSFTSASNSTWIEYAEDSISAIDSLSGEDAWEYIPEPGCSLIQDHVDRDFSGYSIGVTGNIYIAFLICSGNTEEAADVARLVGLNSETGEIAWDPVDNVSLRSTEDSGVIYYTPRVNLSQDGKYFVATIDGNYEVFSVDSGSLIQWTEEEDDNLSSPFAGSFFFRDNQIYSFEAEQTDSVIESFDATSGELLNQTKFSPDFDMVSFPSYSYLRPSNYSSRATVLSDGFLTLACFTECDFNYKGEHKGPIFAVFAPWDEESEEIFLEMEEVYSLRHSLILLPGSVVVTQRDDDGEIVSMTGLG